MTVKKVFLKEHRMITADRLLAHAVGDYILQSDWMVNEKSRKTSAALLHVFFYTLPFLLLTRNPLTLLVIAGTQFIIDRWRLARSLANNHNTSRQPTIIQQGYVSNSIAAVRRGVL